MKCKLLSIRYHNKGRRTLLYLYSKTEYGDHVEHIVSGTDSDFYIPHREIGKAYSQQLSRYVKKVVPNSVQSYLKEQTAKVVTYHPTDVSEIRDEFSKTWQADIPRTRKSMIEYDLYSDYEIPRGCKLVDISDIEPTDSDIEIKAMRFDIEVTHGGKSWDPKKYSDKVISISASMDGNDQGKVFFLRNGTDPQPKDDSYDIEVFETEIELLRAFCDYIEEMEPDVLVCWHKDFDVGYLRERRYYHYRNANLRLPFKRIPVFDLLQAYKRLGSAPSNRLKFVVKYEELVEDVVADEYESKWWGHNNDKLAYYNYKDSEYLELIDDKYGALDFFWGIKEMAGLPHVSDTFSQLRIVDTLLMRMLKDECVLPTTTDVEGKGFKGAVVFDPIGGKHSGGVGIMDVSRCYPTIMIMENLSPEVIELGLEEEGILPRLCKILLDEREKYEVVMDNIFKKEGPGSERYKAALAKRNRIKYLLNSVYGVTGSKYFRIFNTEVSSRTTELGRKVMFKLKEILEKMGHEVIYGDTDSCFAKVSSPDEGIEVAQYCEDRLNEHFDRIGEEYQFGLKLEKWVNPILFKAETKKRYAMRVLWQDGKEVDYIKIKGFEYVRRDSSPIGKEVQKKIMDLTLADEDNKVLSYLRDVRDTFLSGGYSIDEIAYHTTIHKKLTHYDPQPEFIRGSIYFNQHIADKAGRPPIECEDGVRVLYVKHTNCGPATDVVCFFDESDVKDRVKPDLRKMFNREVRNRNEDLLHIIGLSWEKVKGQNDLESFLKC